MYCCTLICYLYTIVLTKVTRNKDMYTNIHTLVQPITCNHIAGNIGNHHNFCHHFLSFITFLCHPFVYVNQLNRLRYINCIDCFYL